MGLGALRLQGEAHLSQLQRGHSVQRVDVEGLAERQAAGGGQGVGLRQMRSSDKRLHSATDLRSGGSELDGSKGQALRCA
jgi:hypothetical protein